MDFVKEFRELYFKSPQISHWTRASGNCDYGDIIVVSKDSYMCFVSSNMDNCLYCHDSRKDNYCADLTFCEECEICYECIDCAKCYNSNYLQDCKNCVDCEYGNYLIGCSDCFGCSGLRRKKFHIFNEKYSEKEYRKKVEELKKGPQEVIWEEFEKVQKKTPRVYMHQDDNEDSFGDYLYHSKNCYWCFDSYLCEDSMYIFNANLERGCKDSMDCGPVANTFERCYDCAYNGYLFDCNHVYWTDWLHDCNWCSHIWHCHHMFGCVYQNHKEYMILNKSVPKGEYDQKTRAINKELARRGLLIYMGCSLID